MSIIRHISESIYNKRTKFGTHMHCDYLYSFILNLVPITTDMIPGRQLELTKIATVKITKLA